MEQLDKSAIGGRIRQLRKSRGLRQWQMAKILGATQPAVHKYENGIVPEVKRLLEIARIGNTSVEWILTGRHWDNGSAEMDRMTVDVCDLAQQLHTFSPEERRAIGSALEVLHAAGRELRSATGYEPRELGDAELGRRLRSLEAHVLEPLMAALAVYDAVVTTLARARVRELHAFSQSDSEVAGPRVDVAVDVPDLQKNAG
ncbi:MAG TPA: helix-turn-helix transcriptional regulator [Candidatus Cryosericum sp.]|nr:helix-turn-helix transcriptional regulator [Candidatus Cryosericum sp.]